MSCAARSSSASIPRGCSARASRRDRCPAPRPPQPPLRRPRRENPAPRGRDARGGGGAQTFVATLVAGLRERLRDRGRRAWAGRRGRARRLGRALGVPVPPRAPPRARPASLPRRRGPARAAQHYRAPRRSRRRADQLVEGRRAGASRARAARRAQAVFTAHGWAFSGRGGASGAVYTAAERAVAPLSDAIVCVSSHDLQFAHERGMPFRAAGCASSTTASTRPAAGPSQRTQGEQLVLGCTARLAPPKDLVTLLEALARPGCRRCGCCASSATGRIARTSSAAATSSGWVSASRCSATATTSRPSSATAKPPR